MTVFSLTDTFNKTDSLDVTPEWMEVLIEGRRGGPIEGYNTLHPEHPLPAEMVTEFSPLWVTVLDLKLRKAEKEPIVGLTEWERALSDELLALG